MPKKPINRNFSNRLNQLMKEHNLTVRQAATIAGVNSSTLQNWRAEGTPTSYLGLKKLAEHMDSTLSFILTGESDADISGKGISLCEIFESKNVFTGYAEITIKKLIPRKKPRRNSK